MDVDTDTMLCWLTSRKKACVGFSCSRRLEEGGGRIMVLLLQDHQHSVCYDRGTTDELGQVTDLQKKEKVSDVKGNVNSQRNFSSVYSEVENLSTHHFTLKVKLEIRSVIWTPATDISFSPTVGHRGVTSGCGFTSAAGIEVKLGDEMISAGFPTLDCFFQLWQRLLLLLFHRDWGFRGSYYGARLMARWAVLRSEISVSWKRLSFHLAKSPW